LARESIEIDQVLYEQYRARRKYAEEHGTCPYCDAKITDGRRTYCSDACSIKFWEKYNYQGTAWSTLRSTVLARDKYLCQYCLKRGLSTPATEVDHVAEIQDGGDEFDEANCLSTCSECHLEKTRLWRAIRRRAKEVGAGEDMLSDDPDTWVMRN